MQPRSILLGWAVLLLVALHAATAQDTKSSIPIIVTSGASTPAAAAELNPVPQRVVAQNTISALPRRPRRARRGSRPVIAEDIPSGTPIAGQYIVIYKDEVADAEAATAETTATAQAAVAAALAPASGSVTDESAAVAADSQVQVLGVTQAPAGVPSQALIQLPAGANHRRVIRSLRRSGKVKTVVKNRVVSIQTRLLLQTEGTASCSAPYFAAGVRGQYAPGMNLNWEGCLTGPDVVPAVFGVRCGTNLDKFMWTGIFAYKPATGQQVSGCVFLKSSITDPSQVSKFFGSCGVSPTLFVGLPTNVCQETSTSPCVDASKIGNYIMQTSSTLCSDSRSDQVVFQGAPCGPNSALTQWSVMTPTGCSPYQRSSTDEKLQSDWLGKCGVPPLLISGVPTRICGRLPPGGTSAPTPPPTVPPPTAPAPAPTPSPPSSGPNSAGRLPSIALASGERLDNWGMGKIGAYDASAKTVLDPRNAVAATGMRVVTIDTGAQVSHPDLNIVEFVDFYDSPGDAYYKQDGNGHGTHVAGIIGAKNQGSGLFGVVPGMPIIAMKVLGSNGQGSLDAVWNAYTEVIARLQKGQKIVSVNLSLGAQVSDSSTVQTECGYVTKIAAYGTAVAVAAGNSNAFLGGFLPATCPDAMTVTSLTSSDSPSSFSNYAFGSTSQNKLKTLVAAPGSNIWSTYINSGYQQLSGTSMATPFVTGAFAECFLAGYCKLGTAPGQVSAVANNYPVMLSGTQRCGNAGGCGPSWGSSNYYGYLLGVRQWRM